MKMTNARMNKVIERGFQRLWTQTCALTGKPTGNADEGDTGRSASEKSERASDGMAEGAKYIGGRLVRAVSKSSAQQAVISPPPIPARALEAGLPVRLIARYLADLLERMEAWAGISLNGETLACEMLGEIANALPNLVEIAGELFGVIVSYALADEEVYEVTTAFLRRFFTVLLALTYKTTYVRRFGNRQSGRGCEGNVAGAEEGAAEFVFLVKSFVLTAISPLLAPSRRARLKGYDPFGALEDDGADTILEAGRRRRVLVGDLHFTAPGERIDGGRGVYEVGQMTLLALLCPSGHCNLGDGEDEGKDEGEGVHRRTDENEDREEVRIEANYLEAYAELVEALADFADLNLGHLPPELHALFGSSSLRSSDQRQATQRLGAKLSRARRSLLPLVRANTLPFLGSTYGGLYQDNSHAAIEGTTLIVQWEPSAAGDKVLAKLLRRAYRRSMRMVGADLDGVAPDPLWTELSVVSAVLHRLHYLTAFPVAKVAMEALREGATDTSSLITGVPVSVRGEDKGAGEGYCDVVEGTLKFIGVVRRSQAGGGGLVEPLSQALERLGREIAEYLHSPSPIRRLRELATLRIVVVLKTGEETDRAVGELLNPALVLASNPASSPALSSVNIASALRLIAERLVMRVTRLGEVGVWEEDEGDDKSAGYGDASEAEKERLRILFQRSFVNIGSILELGPAVHSSIAELVKEAEMAMKASPVELSPRISSQEFLIQSLEGIARLYGYLRRIYALCLPDSSRDSLQDDIQDNLHEPSSNPNQPQPATTDEWLRRRLQHFRAEIGVTERIARLISNAPVPDAALLAQGTTALLPFLFAQPPSTVFSAVPSPSNHTLSDEDWTSLRRLIAGQHEAGLRRGSLSAELAALDVVQAKRILAEAAVTTKSALYLHLAVLRLGLALEDEAGSAWDKLRQSFTLPASTDGAVMETPIWHADALTLILAAARNVIAHNTFSRHEGSGGNDVAYETWLFLYRRDLEARDTIAKELNTVLYIADIRGNLSVEENILAWSRDDGSNGYEGDDLSFVSSSSSFPVSDDMNWPNGVGWPNSVGWPNGGMWYNVRAWQKYGRWLVRLRRLLANAEMLQG